MTGAAGPGRPTPPISLDRPPGEMRQRLASVATTVEDSFLERLRGVCGSVDVDDDSCVDAGRDWWPLTMAWAVDGETPARPAAVARPTNAREVADVLALCNQAGVPVTPMAGRSGVCGASVPAFGGVSLDLCGLAGILAVDDQSLLVDVLPGTFGDRFEDELRASYDLTMGHWPQSIALSTVGGWLACRSAGQYSTRYGKIEDMVVGLEVALADGRVIRTGGRAPRAAAGPDLTQLFVGSEGTLGVITEATLRVHPTPPAERRAAYAFGGQSSFAVGLDACRRILRRGATPAVLRLYDHRESKRTFEVEDRSVLIVLDEAEPLLADAVMQLVDDECVSSSGAERLDDALVARWLEHRNDVSALEKTVRGGITVDTIEIAARWSALPGIYADAVTAARAVAGMWVVSAHQSHAYTDGACLYFTFAGQPTGGDGDRDGEALYRGAWDAVTRATLAHGGAVSHHHGIGLNRSRFMRGALGPALDVLAAVKGALDPAGVLNPGKMGLPSPFGDPPWPAR
ncbi:MAG: alkyldihydroxyacetonephosphate synthase [Acidimicrobiaceae bacterium]|nr:alkyldihydroxyacetonephosphate synthase [Acidimicrobiaceae bacterium]